MKRIVSQLLVLAMLATSLAACAGDPAQTDDTSAADTSAADTTAETTSPPETEANAYNYLPEKNYDGYEYRILYQSGIRYFPRQIDPTESTGDIVNDSAYDRNRAVEAKYGVKTKGYPLSEGEILNAARSHIQSGDDAFDVFYGQIRHLAAFSTEGSCLDISKLDYVDLDMPWYNQDINAGMNIKGKQYIVSGEFINALLANTYSMYFNKSIAAEENLPDLYELVLDGKWTIDKLKEFASGVAHDLDGDGKMTSADRYGWGSNDLSRGALALQYGMGQFTTEFDKNGDPQLILNSNRMATVVDKVIGLVTSGEVYRNTNNINETIVFKEGRMLFHTAIFMQTDLNMRDMEDEYGVLPQPKLDESQEKYYTIINPKCYMYSIPNTVKDQERASILFEAYQYEGYNYVYPGFYELALKTKYSHDDVSAKVYDLIMDGRVCDFGFVFGTTGIRDIISTLAWLGSTDFASEYASKAEATKAEYADIVKSYE